MMRITQLFSLLSLALVIVPCVMFFAGAIGLESMKSLILAGTVGWFFATPVWMSRTSPG